MKKRFYILALILINCSAHKSIITTTYYQPRIQPQKSVDNYFGKEIIDDYRNIENIEDSTVINWYKHQSQYAQDVLQRIKSRDTLIKRIYEIDNRKSYLIKRSVITENDNRFYLKKNVDEEDYMLYYKENSKDEILLYDPKTYKPETNKKYSINYISPSWNEKYIVVSLSHSGKELSDLIIIEMETKKPLTDIIENAWPSSFFGVNWLPDNTGFIYLHFPVADVNDDNFKANTQSVLYTIGQDPKKLHYIFGNKIQPQLIIGSKDYPATKIKSSSDKYIVGYISGVDNYWDAYYAKISELNNDQPTWKPLHSKEQLIQSSEGVFLNDDYIYMTSKNAPNYKIESINVSTSNLNEPKILFKEKIDEVINDFEVTKSAIYVTTTKFGVEANLYKISNGVEKQINLPKKSGKISLYTKSINSDDIWVSLSGWTSSNIRYKLNPVDDTFEEDNLSPKVNYPEFENIQIDEILVKSHDGEEVPLSIIYNKNISKNGSNACLFFGYGAYGDDINPFFSPIFLTWVKDGGILCVPHVRGGGEKGESWRKGGFKTTKPNTWKDLIACTEYMIEEKYTSNDKTVIYSSSAGGIMVGRAMIERPDLFAAVISEVGILNPLRMESQNSGGSNYKEFGTVKDSIECMALIEMDSYIQLEENVDYPAVYLTVGMNDPRVMPWMSGKLAAKMQNKSILKKPVLLYADFDTGHDGSTNMKMYEEWGNVLSFALWQTGHPDYQLKNSPKD